MTQSNDDLGFELPAPVKSSRTRVVVVLVAVVTIAFAIGYTQHHRGGGHAATLPTAEESGAARVEVVRPKLRARASEPRAPH